MTARRLALACAAAAWLVPTCASAHAFLQHAVPGAGATVQHAPASLDLTFTESVEVALSRVRIAAASGRPVTASKPTGGGTTLHVGLDRPLAPGRYTVTWHVVAVDTHPTSGSYTFTVAP